MDVYMKGGFYTVYRRKKDQPYYTNRHSCFLLQYHMVLVTKYRKPVLQGEVGELVNVVKTKTSRFARKKFGDTELRKYYLKPLFWSSSYFVATVSENSLKAVQSYIQNQ